MEVWALEHPELGAIRVERGYDAEFAELYPDWPTPAEGDIREIRHTPTEASIRERLSDLSANPPVRLQVSVAGRVVARYLMVSSGRIPLTEPSREMRGSFVVSDRSRPHLSIEASFFDDLLSVDYREGPTVVEFDPPPGSRGEKRRREMESSAFKRVVYPLATGLGKGGWALAALILGPIVGRVIERIVDWLRQFVPDVEVPGIYLPVPQLPQIYLPTPRVPFPEIAWPQLPAWLLFLLGYSKIWVPVLAGLVVGVLAIRNHRKSEREKERWGKNNGAPGET